MLKNTCSNFAMNMQWWMIQHGPLSVSLLLPSPEMFPSRTGTVSIVSAYHCPYRNWISNTWSMDTLLASGNGLNICLYPASPESLSVSLPVCTCTSAPPSQHQQHVCGCLTFYIHPWCLYMPVCKLVCIFYCLLSNYFQFQNLFLFPYFLTFWIHCQSLVLFLLCVIFCFVLFSSIRWSVRLIYQSLTWNLFSLRVDTFVQPICSLMDVEGGFLV